MDLKQLTGLTVYPNSVVELDGTTYFLARDADGKRLGILGDGSTEQAPPALKARARETCCFAR